jgi:hypothetical protein
MRTQGQSRQKMQEKRCFSRAGVEIAAILAVFRARAAPMSSVLSCKPAKIQAKMGEQPMATRGPWTELEGRIQGAVKLPKRAVAITFLDVAPAGLERDALLLIAGANHALKPYALGRRRELASV